MTITTTDARNKLEDLSGIVLQPGENPYAALIKACNDDPAEIKALYATHRTKRNAQQKEKFLSPDYKELIIDQHLLGLETKPGFVDERNCLVIWARPSDAVIRLAAQVQAKLQAAASSIWLMPTHRMHMTALEVAFSKTPEEIAALVDSIRPALPEITSYLYTHRSRLVKPMVSYDLSAFALSFEPVESDAYTYHHVRRDVFDKVKESGVEVGSRYQVPSAHITLGRYLNDGDHDTPEKREQWVKTIDEINAWLDTETIEWAVGEERGLDARAGALWYGGGRTILLGEGF